MKKIEMEIVIYTAVKLMTMDQTMFGMSETDAEKYVLESIGLLESNWKEIQKKVDGYISINNILTEQEEEENKNDN